MNSVKFELRPEIFIQEKKLNMRLRCHEHFFGPQCVKENSLKSAHGWAEDSEMVYAA